LTEKNNKARRRRKKEMDLAQQFGAVKLKKAAGGTHDRSAPIVAGAPPIYYLNNRVQPK
jgi:hypothetical protein